MQWLQADIHRLVEDYVDIIEYQCPTSIVQALPGSFRHLQHIAKHGHTQVILEATIVISISIREVTPYIDTYWPINKTSEQILFLLPYLAVALSPTEPPMPSYAMDVMAATSDQEESSSAASSDSDNDNNQGVNTPPSLVSMRHEPFPNDFIMAAPTVSPATDPAASVEGLIKSMRVSTSSIPMIDERPVGMEPAAELVESTA